MNGLRDRLVADFPELAPGLVLRELLTAHTQLRRQQTASDTAEGLAEAVELLTRQRLLLRLQTAGRR